MASQASYLKGIEAAVDENCTQIALIEKADNRVN